MSTPTPPTETMELNSQNKPLVFNSTTDTTSKQNVLLIDSSVLDSQLFYESANENTYPIMYSESSTKEELLQVLNDKFPNGFNRLSIVFHDPGYNLYKGFLNNKGLFEESDLLENATTFSENAAFLINLLKNKKILKMDFLSCNTLNYPIWKQFYEVLQLQTNVIVGASNDATGNVKYGADWLMESTNEDIKNIYFNENIKKYASTLAETVITSSNTIYIRQQTSASNLEYSTNNQSTWTSVGTNYPIAITNVNTATNVNTVTNVYVKFTTDITISSTIGSTNGYFYPTTSYITFDGLKSDNSTRCQITIDGVSGYPGFFRNGTISNNGTSHVTVQNFKITSQATTSLANHAGFLCHSYFSKGVGNGGIINCANFGDITTAYAGGIVGGYATGIILINKCENSGNITGDYAGGIVGASFAKNRSNTCTISNCYNVGNISGTNAGGIFGADIGRRDNDTSSPTINISNCYSIGTIGVSCGGLLGGRTDTTTDDLTYQTINITNCYSSGNALPGSRAFVASSLRITNLTKTRCYIDDNVWSDSSANDLTNLSDTPTNVYAQGQVWTKLAGTNIPYVLSAFNSDIYSTKLVSSVDVRQTTYSSTLGLFTGTYNINSITFNNTPYDNATNYITINSETGELTFQSGLSNGKYEVNVFVAKYNANNTHYDYNYSTFTITDLSCFNHDTKILCLNDQSIEEYVPIQDLRKGHLVKTYLHGYKKIQCIGKGDMMNNPTDWKKCMFKMEKKEENVLIEDLIITGWHGVLVDNLEPTEEEFQEKIHFSQRIDDKDILLASASSKFKPMDNEDKYTFYNFALEDDDDENKRFGVYANGLLVEIPSKNMFLSKHYDEM